MITVQMGKTSLQVCGHAGISRYGSDIVCAAASMLAFALAEAVQTEGFWTPPVVEAACGTFRLEVRPEAREQARAETMFDVVRAGYRLLAERYPAYVRVLSDGHSENSMQKSGVRPPDGQKEETE